MSQSLSVRTSAHAGCTGIIVARMDSAYYSSAACHAARQGGASFSVTARLDPAVKAAITGIPDDGWTPIRYPRAIWDNQAGRWVSDAGVAETTYTAFASRTGKAITARLIVRRVKDLSPRVAGQGELFTAWRYHAVFTDLPLITLQAEAKHRQVWTVRRPARPRSPHHHQRNHSRDRAVHLTRGSLPARRSSIIRWVAASWTA